jgi:hypothetical protein
MAFKSASGVKLLLKIGDGVEGAEAFTAYCSISAKSISFDGTEATSETPNCPVDDAISWIESEMQSKRVTIEGSGKLNTPDFDKFYDWWDAGESKNCQVVLDVVAADGGRILTGAFKMPKFSLVGNKGEKCEVTISIASDGPVVKTNNA